MSDQLTEYTHREAVRSAGDERWAQSSRHMAPLQRDLVLERHTQAMRAAVDRAARILARLPAEHRDTVREALDDLVYSVRRAEGDVVRTMSAFDIGNP
jgi:hypothetical protein